VKRIQHIVPGNDCINGTCRVEGCPGKQGRSSAGHGSHGEEWYYVVVEDTGLVALGLTVYTDIYPATVLIEPRERLRPLKERRSGADLSFHIAFPVELGDLCTHVPGQPYGNPGCDWLPGGRCVSWGSTALGAREFFDQHGDPAGPDQAESFWQALEAYLVKRAPRIHAERVDETHERCPRCAGVGVVERIKAVKQRHRGGRFEDSIAVLCCGDPMRCCGNMSLREAGAKVTAIAYECAKCFKRVQVQDDWSTPSPEQLAINDTVE
jgi:hypothetical protein